MTQTQQPRPKTLTKQQIRAVARGSFPGLECSYGESTTPTTTTGTLRVGAAAHVVSCPRGGERDLRAEMYQALKQGWEAASGKKVDDV